MSKWAECSPLVQGQGLKPQLIPIAGAPTQLPAHSYETGTSWQLTKKLYQIDLIQTWSYHLTRQEKPNLSWPPSALGWVLWLPWARTLQKDLTESKMQFRGLWKMNKFELNQHMAFIRWRNGYELQSLLPRAHSYSLWSLEFHRHFGAQSVKTICHWSQDTPKETLRGKCDSISRRAQLHKRRGVAEPQLFWFTSRLSQSWELHSLKRMVQTQSYTLFSLPAALGR